MKPRTQPRRMSEKRLKSLNGKPIFSSISPSGKGVRRKKRKVSDFNRIYGSKARMLFVKGLPCSACGVEGFSENAHLAPPGEKGTGYKAGYEFIAPLCHSRYWTLPDGKWNGMIGCHPLFDQHRNVFNARFPDFNAVEAAARCEAQWLQHSGETK